MRLWRRLLCAVFGCSWAILSGPRGVRLTLSALRAVAGGPPQWCLSKCARCGAVHDDRPRPTIEELRRRAARRG